jgi:hypothetical protein
MMKKRRKCMALAGLALLVLLLCAVNVFAQVPEKPEKWVDRGRDSLGVNFFSAENPVEGAGTNLVKIWKKRIFPRGAYQQEILSLDEYDCYERTYRTVTLEVTDWNNQVQSTDKPSEWMAIYADMVEWDILNKVCRK